MASDLACLDLIVERATGNAVERDILKRKLRKHLRLHGMQHLYDHLQYDMRYRLCCAKLYLGDFSNWTGWIYREKQAAEKFWLDIYPWPRWTGNPVESLYIVGEQGIGDEILWASCLPDCLNLAKKVSYCCDPRLVSILGRAFPQVDVFPRTEEDPAGNFSAFIPAADLFPLFRKSRQSFPAKKYLVPEEALETGRVGVGWAGRQGWINPKTLGLENPLSLQHTWSWPGIEEPQIDLKDDLEAVLSLVCGLKEVVCVPSSIHHIAGAAGVKVSVILPDHEGEIQNQVPWSHPPGKMPWYPDVTVYRSVQEWRKSRGLQRHGCGGTTWLNSRP